MWHQTQYTQWFLLQFLSLKGRSRLMRSPSFLCHSIIPLNHIFTNSMKLMPLETTTTLSFLELVISTWWTCRHVNWEVNIMSFVKKTHHLGKSHKNTFVRIQEKPIQTILIPFRENITFVCAKENMHFWVFFKHCTLKYEPQKCNTQSLTK